MVTKCSRFVDDVGSLSTSLNLDSFLEVLGAILSVIHGCVPIRKHYSNSVLCFSSGLDAFSIRKPNLIHILVVEPAAG